MSIGTNSLSSPPSRPATPLWKRLLYPVIVLIVCGSLFAVPLIRDALDHEVSIPETMLLYWAPLLALILLVPWWLFFAGFRWTTRLAVALLVVVGVGSFLYFGIRKTEMDLRRSWLLPSFQFAWETSPEEKMAQFLKTQPTSSESSAALDATVGPEDYPSYRGAKRDGVVAFARLNTGWENAPPKVVWRHPCLGGYSGIAVAGKIAVTLEQRGQEESIVCYDRATGDQHWAYAYPAYYKDVMGDGPRATPAIHEQRIFSLGAAGDLVCVDTAGKLKWTVNILKDNKAKNIKWGLSGSPLIVDDLVVVNAGIDPDAPADASLAAYEQATGKKRWATGNRKAGYSSPQLAHLGGKAQILLFDGSGLVSYDPKDGKELWQTPWVTEYEMNSIQPVVVGDDRVFISSEAANGCELLRVKAPANDSAKWSVESVWKNKNLAARFANPVTDGKHIYGLHNVPGVIRCLDVSDGKILWKGERYGAGQLLLADQTLIVVSAKGVVSLVATDQQQYKELGRFPVFNEKTWNTPALAGDQLFLRNQMEIACVKLPMR